MVELRQHTQACTVQNKTKPKIQETEIIKRNELGKSCTKMLQVLKYLLGETYTLKEEYSTDTRPERQLQVCSVKCFKEIKKIKSKIPFRKLKGRFLYLYIKRQQDGVTGPKWVQLCCITSLTFQ